MQNLNNPNLTRQFDAVAQAVRAILPDLSREAIAKAGGDIDALPSVSEKTWSLSAGPNDSVTSYNYALNRSDIVRATPGSLFLQTNPNHKLLFDADRWALSDKSKHLFSFTELLRERLQKDGLKLAEDHALSFEMGHRPIALFVGEKADLKAISPLVSSNDFSFYALRKTEEGGVLRAVWARKDMGQSVVVCPDAPDSLFEDARKRGYTYFAGFYQLKITDAQKNKNGALASAASNPVLA